MCYLGTGTTEKNMKSFYSYPDIIQEKIRTNDKLSGMIPKKSSYLASFISNYVLFTVVFSIVGLILRIDGFWNNLWYFLIMGIGLNLFDLFVIDMLCGGVTQREPDLRNWAQMQKSIRIRKSILWHLSEGFRYSFV